MALGKPAISTPNALDLRAVQGAVSAARQRIEALEAALVVLQGLVGSSTAIAALQAQINAIVRASGTVTRVEATVPDILTLTGSPITTAGTLAFGLADQAASTVLAGPASGVDAPPGFRNLQWDFDLPLITSVSYSSGLDGSEAVLIERYGQLLWVTTQDIANLAVSEIPVFSWRSVGSDYTLVAADAENGVETTGNTGAQVITVPDHGTATFAIGTSIVLLQRGGATLQVVAHSGVALLYRSVFVAVAGGQYSPLTLLKTAEDEWVLCGDLALA